MSELRYLVVHGHFYQPPREDPFTGEMPREHGCEPYANYNQKITAECYRPNAENGNFGKISFDLGPTLASWLERYEAHTYQLILEADRENVQRYGIGNAMAQAYNHTILPLSTSQEKRIQITWGVADFVRRFGHQPAGLWLPETAVDYETLEILADFRIQFTVLAPWQAEGKVDPSEPYLVRLPSGRAITVFFFNAEISRQTSFDPAATVNADAFSANELSQRLNQEKLKRGEPQLLLIATDGELYGHHQPWRDRFLEYLLNTAAPQRGYQVVTLARYLQLYPPKKEVAIREKTAWSCHHGVQRWYDSCGCCEKDGTWKWQLRAALNRLAAKIDLIFKTEAPRLLRDPWAALGDYLALRSGATTRQDFFDRHVTRPLPHAEEAKLLSLLEAEYYRHLMFTSCGFFFDDLDRLEPRHNIACAARAIAILHEAHNFSLAEEFVDDLKSVRSEKTKVTGKEIFEGIMAVVAAREMAGPEKARSLNLLPQTEEEVQAGALVGVGAGRQN